MLQFLALLALDLAGLVLLWFLLRARIRRFLELENLLEGVREEARGLVMELNETADRNVSLLGDRIAALRSLLDEVDRRMGVARRELEARETEREVFERLRRRKPIVPEATGGEASARLEQPPAEPTRAERVPSEAPGEAGSDIPESTPIPLALRGGRGEGTADRAAGASFGRRVPEIVFPAEQVKPARSLRDEALDLYRKGFSADIIAARLGATVAEIELIVEMDERRVEMLERRAEDAGG